jgi:hypothetical protein
MKRQELIQQSIYIVTEYYKNNLEPFFACLAEDVLWIGPRKEQILRGRETMIRTWSSAEQQPTFSMGNITEYSVSTGRTIWRSCWNTTSTPTSETVRLTVITSGFTCPGDADGRRILKASGSRSRGFT